MAREDRKVLDYATGSMVIQGEMLKQLLKRSRLGRNQWHEEAQKRTSAYWSSKSRLSDMFSGKRPLPLRDIIPLIDALQLSAEETDHYCCEFFRANVPENLGRYIAPHRRSKRFALMQKRIGDLEKLVSDLQIKHYFLTNVQHALQIQDMKDEISYLKESRNEYRTKYQELKVKHSRTDTSMNGRDPEEVWFQQQQEAEEDALEQLMTQFEEMESKHNPMEDDHAENEKSGYVSLEKYRQESNTWEKALCELEPLQDRANAELEQQIRCYLPRDIIEQLSAFMQAHPLHTGAAYRDYQTELQWDWVHARVQQRNHVYVLISLFSLWKRANPDEFDKSEQYYRDYLSAPSYEQKYELQKARSYDCSFSNYLSKHLSSLSKTCPNLYLLVKPIDTPRIIDSRAQENEVFSLYFEHLNSGLFGRLSFEEYYESISPSAVNCSNLFQGLAPIVIANTLKVETSKGQGTLAHFFEGYGTACEKYTSAADYLKFQINKKMTARQVKELCCRLTRELVALGPSKQHREILIFWDNLSEASGPFRDRLEKQKQAAEEDFESLIKDP